ncbi:MAG: polysaccharide pyruvyl transferase family protein [Bifidobacteriaceae bacterium]|jgi:2-succinyl-5-enolpyruvyl-6-hydroxy-3-cyclohexene-1-carboxylate synthase|nr:polysaccharide pyruvyl transferase family protein [Bifidobacteriaceae bacterium]
MFTTDKAASTVIELLKQYNIKKIVVSPGMTNVPLSMTVQSDPFFEVYSVVDERGAAYFATGLAYESGEPVVISCTGATASRNYIPALTEAYYRNIPIVCITSQHHTADKRDLVAQVTDRSVSQNDIKKVSVMLPFIKDAEDQEACELLTNEALIKATAKGGGPVHINLPVDNTYPFKNTMQNVPVRKIDYYDNSISRYAVNKLKNQLKTKKIGIFIGSHRIFTASEIDLINDFVQSYDVAVYADHTANYTGKNRINNTQIFELAKSPDRPDLIIDLGSIVENYSHGLLYGIPTWRISEDGEFHNRFHALKILFDMQESLFFELLTGDGYSNHKFYKSLKSQIDAYKVPEVPFSNTYISSKLSEKLPKNTNLHCSILNSIRNMDIFDVDSSVHVTSNVGGFGIDGAVSTLVGQSMANLNKLNFGLIGDLAFFYDMNGLGIRHISNNIRIIMINNSEGVEFRLNARLEPMWGSETDLLIAAKGHNGSAKAWAESMGFEYISATDCESFDEQIDKFCSSSLDAFNKPVFFEAFTTVEEEQEAFHKIRNIERPKSGVAGATSSNAGSTDTSFSTGTDRVFQNYDGTPGISDATRQLARAIKRKLRPRTRLLAAIGKDPVLLEEKRIEAEKAAEDKRAAAEKLAQNQQTLQEYIPKNAQKDGLIVTLTGNFNYGNIVQRYALKHILSQNKLNFDTTYLQVNPNDNTSPIFENTREFVSKYIGGEDFDPFKLQGYRNYVVGSDQVWRDWYLGNWDMLAPHFFEFIDDDLEFDDEYVNKNANRISYAASFGVDDIDVAMTSEIQEKVAPEIKKFDAISVRESSGIDMIKNTWGPDATLVLDPTLLLTKEDYSELIENSSSKNTKIEKLFYYVLDTDDNKNTFISNISKTIGGQITEFDLPPSDGEIPFKPVEDWLKGFRDSEFVVTDSFHGMVFSIINNTDFVVIGNKVRGLARFESLLGVLGLTHRLLDEEGLQSVTYDDLGKIDWKSVNKKLEKLRNQSLNWLLENLK